MGTDGGVRFIDQERKLANGRTYITATSYQQVGYHYFDHGRWRRSPAIGVEAAMGVAIGVLQSDAKGPVAGFYVRDLEPDISKAIGRGRGLNGGEPFLGAISNGALARLIPGRKKPASC